MTRSPRFVLNYNNTPNKYPQRNDIRYKLSYFCKTEQIFKGCFTLKSIQNWTDMHYDCRQYRVDRETPLFAIFLCAVCLRWLVRKSRSLRITVACSPTQVSPAYSRQYLRCHISPLAFRHVYAKHNYIVCLF